MRELPVIFMQVNNIMKMAISGGIQKEAFFYKVPCITLREYTEWVETIEQGVNKLTGVKPENIAEAINSFQPENTKFNKPLFGDGATSSKIVEIILQNID